VQKNTRDIQAAKPYTVDAEFTQLREGDDAAH
jgi:hypothetical protein